MAANPELLQRHRLTVDEYYRMAEAGVLAPDARVELIEGEIIDMAPIGTRHASSVRLLTQRLSAVVGSHAIVSVQSPLRVGSRSEPEPDLALLKPRDDFYAQAHPTPADTLLVIEVADSTAAYDRQVKAPLYARHGVPELWIVDLDAGQLRFLRRPDGERYTDITATETPGLTALPGLGDVRVDLAGLLS